jgi:heterodisulfide reductase subunit C
LKQAEDGCPKQEDAARSENARENRVESEEQMGRGTMVQSKLTAEEMSRKVRSVHDGERALQCLQCGTCTASCPLSHLMDYPPRQIFGALRTGEVGLVLGSNTPWLCSSCYSCQVRCPAKIPITEVMYELKSMAMQQGTYPKGETMPLLAQTFAEQVTKAGRNAEFALMRRFYIRGRLFGQALKNMGMARKLLAKGRLPLRSRKVKGAEQIAKLLEAAESVAERGS